MATGEGTSLADRKRRAGQRLVLGFDGLAVTDDLRALVSDVGPAGFLLFTRNVSEPEQVFELTRELRDLCDPAYPPLIFVDQEGGRVQRIREPATVWPSAEELAASGRVADVAFALGTELRAMGIDVNLAPVADVGRSDTHAVIGDRSFGTSENRVAEAVAAFVTGLERANIRSVAKHYPGHGGATTDSHEMLPVVELDRPELEAVDLRPFHAAIAAGARAVLVAHVLYPALDEEWPASLSPRVLGTLRSTFDGLLLSDDLEMGALTTTHPTERVARQLALAGLDLAIVGHTPTAQADTYECFVHDQEADALFDRLAKDASARLHAFRERTFLGVPPRPDLSVVGSREHRQLRDDVLFRVRGQV